MSKTVLERPCYMCRHWQRIGDSGFGVCRRGEGIVTTHWITECEDTCAGWKIANAVWESAYVWGCGEK